MNDVSAECGQRVAVITRTLNRPLFLARAAECVLAQTWRDFLWVIVNDGGAAEPVEAIAERARAGGLHVVVRHHAMPVGMEAASNAGIAMSGSTPYIVIHDDDDTWQPGFLAQTVAFLDAHPHYVAVVTQAWYVRERILDGRIEFIRRRPMNRGLRHLSISQLYARNLYTTNSLLFRRSAYEAVGAFDETLPVQGDWEFNLRLIMHGDIGVVPELLANYHVRPGAAASDTSSNSVQGRQDLHHEYETIIRNRMLRAALKDMGASGGLLFACLNPASTPGKIVQRHAESPLARLMGRLRGLFSR